MQQRLANLWPVLTLALLLAPAVAPAHDADIVYAHLTRDDQGRVVERLTMTAATLSLLAPVDGDRDGVLTAEELRRRQASIEAGVWDQAPLRGQDGACTREGTQAKLRETYVELLAAYRCPPGALTQTFELLAVLPRGYRVVLGAFGQGGQGSTVYAEGTARILVMFKGGPPPSAISGLWAWFVQGVVHILEGVDHLAFLLAVLVVGGGWRRLLLLVTSFTLAHSITLGATALGVFSLGPSHQKWVEVAIAGSILWMALENLLLPAHRHRAALTFLFGLVHGFGFAQVLTSLGLGQDVVRGLLGFNLGVEAGQAAVVIVLWPILWAIERRPNVHRWTVRAVSAAVAVAGAWWLVQRLG